MDFVLFSIVFFTAIESSAICRITKSDFFYKWFRLMFYRLSQLVLRCFEGKTFLFDKIKYYQNVWDFIFSETPW